MLIEIPVDPNEVDYINTKLPLVTQKLTIALMLLLQQLHEADRKKEVFIGHGMDADAVRQTNEREQRAAEVKAETFKLPADEIERKAELARLDKEVEAEKRKVRW
jgi:hypothetical protein